MKHALYAASGPKGLFTNSDVLSRVVAYQVPLFEHGGKDEWGHIDLWGSMS